MSEIQKTRFWHQLKSYGFKRFFISPDFLIAIAVLCALVLDKYFNLSIFVNQDSSFIIAIFAAAATLFAITLAALAILLSFSSSDFVKFLQANNKLSGLLFMFWVGNAAYLLVIALAICSLLLNILSGIKVLVLYPLVVSLFVYALIDTFYILGAVIRFGHFLDIYSKTKNDK